MRYTSILFFVLSLIASQAHSAPPLVLNHASAAEQIAKLDQNADGRLAYMEAMLDLEIAHSFARIDSNHDGFVDEKELRKAQQAAKSAQQLTKRFNSLRGA